MRMGINMITFCNHTTFKDLCPDCKNINTIIEAEALLFRAQSLLDESDKGRQLFEEIQDYYKEYILPTHKEDEWTSNDILEREG